MSLRQRTTLADKDSAGSRAGSDNEEKSLDCRSAASGILGGGRVYVLLGSVALALIFLYQRATSVPLPETYALCSSSGSQIYTVDDANARVECILVHKDTIIATGSLPEVTQHWESSFPLTSVHANSTQQYSAQSLDVRYVAKGSIVVPGMSDSHTHILEYGGSKQIPLESGKTVKATVALVRKYIQANPDILNDKTKFIEGWGWDHTSWAMEQWPTAQDLEADPIVRGRPVVMQSKDGHALWVSAKVIESSAPFPDVIEGGTMLRDASGKPTGVFIDDAQYLVKRPDLSEDDLLKRWARAAQDALSLGLTSMHDAGFSPVSLDFFSRQAEKGNMPIRVYGMTFFDEKNQYWGDQRAPIIGAANGRLNARSVKIFADGALRSGGAALYEPYADNPESTGFMRISVDVLNTFIPKFLRDGWQVNVHAIGDRANGIVLDAFEAALEGANVSALRPRLEHAQIMTKADMERVGKLGVIASIQPTHAISDMWFGEDRLGPERVKGLYAFRSLIDSGARIALGSDCPVEDINPLSGFYAAITRVSPDGQSPHGPGGWFPEQRLSRVEALRGMTIDPAYASFTESSLGSLIPGKRADYVVLSQDIMSIPVDQILATKVVATAIDGRPVYGHI
ncbi:hypothetical protein PLICRDRAFT_37025 [Plicaturopsis crispa FD-325 SS-3]|nr:hypothetical protein PLICRDRAFT_37025 [Plicaturopsis crispa FD-325 SS-3]